MKNLTHFFLILGICTGLNAQTNIGLKARLDSLVKDVPGLAEEVDFTLVEAPITELLRAVAETHNLNVSFSNLPAIRITNNFTNVVVKDLLLFLCKEYNLNIKFTNNIFTFYEVKVVQKREIVSIDSLGNVTIDARGNRLNEVTKALTEVSSYNVIANQTIDQKVVNAYIRDLPMEVAVQNFSEINNLQILKKENGVFQIYEEEAVENTRQGNSRSRRNNSRAGYKLQTFRVGENGFISLQCEGVQAQQVIQQISDDLNIDYLFVNPPQGQLDCHLDSVSVNDFLQIALETSNQTFSISEDGIYLIGEPKGIINESVVVTFNNRSIEGILDIIPKTLLEKVTAQEFNELNALILTGSEQSVQRVEDFLVQIDRPVPNVLIEVIVTELNKGYSLNTGLKAYLSDSVPKTSGQIFGGVDATISSESFNNFLNNLDGTTGMNLGRVAPNFYATIEAMEENNDLDVRSTPKLSTMNGHEASLTIGQSVYYLIETQNVTGGTNPIVTVTPRYEKVEANLDIKITPFVSNWEDVILTIEAEFSDFIEPTIQGAPPGNSSRKFVSKIRVKNEEMIVLGGLEEARKSETGSGTPLLSRIPILKWIFSSKSKANSDNKLLIFIKPTIVY